MGATARYHTAWSRRPPARIAREVMYLGMLGPLVDLYAHPKVLGRERLRSLQAPVIFAANHSSHLDTPVILRALPARWRHRTVVVAAEDYFYGDRLRRFMVSLAFGTIPVERDRLSARSAQRMDRVLEAGWSVLIYPEGSRTRTGKLGRLHHGASYLAVAHKVPIVPIGLYGTHDAMPPGAAWPHRHPVTMRIGEPVHPDTGDHHKLTEQLRDVFVALGAPA